MFGWSMPRFLIVFLTLLLAACATTPTEREQAQTRPLTILISIDGFRSDYLEAGATPVLAELAAEGARGPMRPSFPSLTFPNHHTLVTGLHPDHHGVVGNNFDDPVLGRFSQAKKETPWWNEAEPIWVTAEKAGLTTASIFWPGSETEIRGRRPTYWRPYDSEVGNRARVDQVLAWLDQADARPDLVTLYFDVVDTVGHDTGPGSPETLAAASQVDAAIGGLVQGLKDRGVYDRTTLVIVSDHGMAPIRPDQTIYLNDAVPAGALDVIYVSGVAYLAPTPGHEAEVDAALIGRRDHYECWRRGEIPARFVLGSNPRVPPIVCLADIDWYLATHVRPLTHAGGAHGFDNASTEMQALFIAHGPGIARGVVLKDMDSVDVQPLLGRLLGVAVPAGDGRAADTLPAMRR